MPSYCCFCIIWYYYYIIEDFPLRKKELGFGYVYVEKNGSVREFDAEEKEYLSTKFSLADGARPFVKSSYKQRTPDNKIWEYLLRYRMPSIINIKHCNQK
jgi:hypothetical protein